MTLPILWRESADNDLDAITEYIGQRNVDAAERMWWRLRNVVLPLAEHPYLYRQSVRIPGCREIVAHPNYIVLYRVTDVHIEIVSVAHAHQQFPPQNSGS